MTSRIETMPTAWSSSTTGRCRKPFSTMIRAASAGDVSGVAVTGSDVIQSRTRASDECTRPATARRMSRSLRMPIRRP